MCFFRLFWGFFLMFLFFCFCFFKNFCASQIHVHLCTGDKNHSRPLLPQLELVEGRRPRVSTLLLHYFYTKYAKYYIYFLNSRLICDLSQKTVKQSNTTVRKTESTLAESTWSNCHYVSECVFVYVQLHSKVWKGLLPISENSPYNRLLAYM